MCSQSRYWQTIVILSPISRCYQMTQCGWKSECKTYFQKQNFTLIHPYPTADIFSETQFHPYSPLSHCRHIFRNRISPLFTLISPTARISPSAIFSHHNFTLIQPYLTHSHIHTTTSPLFSIIPSTISPLFNLIPPAAIFSHCNFTLIQQPYSHHNFTLIHLYTIYLHFITTRLNKKMSVRKYMNWGQQDIRAVRYKHSPKSYLVTLAMHAPGFFLLHVGALSTPHFATLSSHQGRNHTLPGASRGI